MNDVRADEVELMTKLTKYSQLYKDKVNEDGHLSLTLMKYVLCESKGKQINSEMF